MADGEVADRAVQGGREGPAEVGVGAGFDLACAPAGADGHGAEFTEEDGLADAAESGEDEAAFGAAAGDSFQDDLEGVHLLVAAGELRGALAGSGRERIADGVHGSDGIRLSWPDPRFRYRTRSRVVDRLVYESLGVVGERLIRGDQTCSIAPSRAFSRIY
ncbi:hypothetical protein PSU4_55180 [Pseudonocardia sulfidoxydans NBRC 16205]|uniref:Uncharacterized protein n=1 Tax=Pseudonocardia sulfidoxydans NBRC 16205 TaxID=1223511 RepID=A0A511DS40_9PSEU|nr:hypothetical protein PSU4_55180 [Pseudonocardia sulfidoxydans NBRC 16205]